jgi:predicted cupin superfamily sugar epimerase
VAADPAPPAPIAELVASLGLEAHPEGGWYRRVWAADHVVDPATDRRAASAIHFLLAEGDRSTWHRLTDAEEVWIHRSGAPLALHLSPDGVTEQVLVLGPDPSAGHEPTVVVPVGHWQSAEPVAPPAPVVLDEPGTHRPPPEPGSTSGAQPVALAEPASGPGWSLVTCVVSPEFRFDRFELAPPCWEPGGDQV